MSSWNPISSIRARWDFPGAARPSALAFAVLAATALPSLPGCHAMSSPQEAGMELAVKIDTSKPIRFSRHDFGVACYDTYGCRVVYAGRVRAEYAIDSKSPSTAELEGDFREYLQAGYIGIPNFPAPAVVSWRSADGTQLAADVDMGAIFKDETVLHRVPPEQLPPYLYVPVEPEIVLVVNDRTVQVYMRAHITTAVLQEPGNRYSGFRSDPILVYSKTY